MLDSPLISLLFWILICFSIAALFTKRYSVRPLIVALILRSIYYLGIGPTLNILGALNVSARGSHLDHPATSQRPLLHPTPSSLGWNSRRIMHLQWGPLCASPVFLDNWDADTRGPSRSPSFEAPASGLLCTLCQLSTAGHTVLLEIAKLCIFWHFPDGWK